MIYEKTSISAFDCDDTLVMWPKDFRKNKPGRIKFIYGNEYVYLIEHSYHITFLKHCITRGDLVIVWSQNGPMWAKQVCDALGIDIDNVIVMGKPTRHIDDKTSVASIAGNHIYIPHETYDGAE